MGLRNIPAILRYAEQVGRLSPNAWLYCFTNPAGMVTQALRDAGFARSIGICDGANGAVGGGRRLHGLPAGMSCVPRSSG